MPQVQVTINRPEVAVTTSTTAPQVSVNDTQVGITQSVNEIAVTTAPSTVSINTNATTIQTVTLDEAFRGEWDNDATYHRGDLVRYEQSVYVFINTTPQTTNPPDVDTDLWVLLFSESGLTGNQVVALNRAYNLTVWDANTSYSLGDIVVRDETHDNDGLQNQLFPVLYRLYDTSGAINTDPLTHHAFPSYSGGVPVYDVNSSWQRLVGVCSLNGYSGDLTLTTDEIPEGATNFYWTETRFDNSFAGKTTTDLTEGSNLYYTDDRVNTFLTDGSVSSINFGGNTSLTWNPDDATLEFPVNGEVTLQIGQENLIKVKNTTGSTITNGQVVRVTGATGNNITVAYADYSSEALSSTTIAVATQTINNNGVGFATTQGLVRGLDTSAYAEGTALWLGANGSYTSTKPLSPLHLVLVGWVVRSHATEGTIFVAVSNGWELDELHNVLIVNEANNEILQYDSATGVWKNRPGTTTSIAEGTNLYYTTARANSDFDTRLATKTTADLAEGSNLYYTQARFDTAFGNKTTTNLAEGSNLYYTTARANTDFDSRLATKTTTNLAEGTNLYYTTARQNTDFDNRLATKTTSNLAEGTNLYFTNARARSALSGGTGITYNSTSGSIAVDTSTIATQSYVSTAISNLIDSAPSTLDTLNELAAALGDDPNFATTITTALGNKLNTADFTTTANTWYATSNPIQNNTTDDLAEGTTNLYYTELRATNNFDNNLSLATTDDLSEGSTNLYFTTGRARNSISATGDIAYDPNTGIISYTAPTYTTDDISEGTTNLYFTTARARASISAGTGISYDSATGVISATGGGGGAVDSVNGQTGVVVLDTDDIAEGTTNLYHTDSRSRSSISVTTASQTAPTPSPILEYNSTTGVLTSRNPDASQVGGLINGTDLAQDAFDNSVYVKTLRDGTHTLGTHIISYNPNAMPLEPTSALLDGTSSLDVFSAPGGPTGKGYGVSASLNYFAGDTLAGINSAAAFSFRAATGPATAPTATVANQVVGTINSGTYATTDWSSIIATDNAGGGKTVFHPLQYQFYATQDVTESTFNLTTTSAIQSNLTISGVVSSGNGVFTNTSTDIRPYDVVRVFGTLTGTMSFPGYVSGNLYRVIAGGNPTTTFTLSNVDDGDPISTTAGTTTGLTFQKCRTLFNAPVGSNGSYFGAGGVLTATGFTPSGMNGTFRVIYYNSSTGQVGVGNYQASGNATVQGSITGGAVIQGGMGYRVRAFPDSRYYNINNRINLIDHNATTATYRSDSHIWQGATNTYQYLNLNAAGGSFNVGTMTIKDLTGANTYFSAGIVATKTFTPFRYNLTAGGNFAAGSTYTPASSVTNAISATINSGASATFTIAVTNLKASATEGGHYQISVTNTSGADQTVTTSGCNTNPSLVLTNGSSCVVTVYVVGTLAFGEILT